MRLVSFKTNNWQQVAQWLVKLGLAVGLCWLLYHQVTQQLDQLSPGKYWSTFDWANRYWISWVLLLVPLNWGLEATKWRLLLFPLYPISRSEALKGVLAGVSLSLFTPARVGDYAGRVLAVPHAYRWSAFLATAMGNYAQLLVLIGLGVLGAGYLVRAEGLMGNVGIYWWGLAASTVMLLSTVLFFKVNTAARRVDGWLSMLPLSSYPLLRKLRLGIKKKLRLFRCFETETLRGALAVALLRYVVYSLQYFCLLRFFGVPLPFDLAISGIAAVFLLQSGLPLPAAMGPLVRSGAAIWVWAAYTNDVLGILAASFGLFIINLAIPALLGMVYLTKADLLR